MSHNRLINKVQERARKRPDSYNQLHFLYTMWLNPRVEDVYSISRSKLKQFAKALDRPLNDGLTRAIEGLCETFVNEGAFEQFRINTRHLESYAIELERACANLISLLERREESFDGYLTVTDVLIKHSVAARLRVSPDEIRALPATLERFSADVSRIARDNRPKKNRAGGQEDLAFNEFMQGLRWVADEVRARTALPGKGESK